MKVFPRCVFYFLFLLFSAALGTSETKKTFSGKVEYDIRSSGENWEFTLWKSGPLWRSELRLGLNVYQLRMGNLETGEAYLVNEGGKTYRPLGRRDMGGRNDREGSKKAKAKEKEIEFAKIVVEKADIKELLAYELKHDQLKGKGPRFDLFTTEALGPISGNALPVFKKTEEKIPYFVVYFRETGGFPLEIAVSGKSDAYSMVARSVEEREIEEEFLILPSDFKPQMRGPGGPGGDRKGGGGGGPRSGSRGGGGPRGG